MRSTHRHLVSVVILFVLVFSQFALPQPASAATNRYVVASGGLTTGPCDSWVDACTLTRALTAAVSGDEIWVQQGTYTPGSNRSDTFTIPDGVAVYGGFVGTETLRSQRDSNPTWTILSGEIGTAAQTDNSYHVVTIANSAQAATLDGFTVTWGYIAESDGNPNGPYGAGIYITNSSPILNNLIVTNNRAGNTVGSGGGGIYMSDTDGVPIIAPQISYVSITSNQSGRGGGLFSQNADPIIENVVFFDNDALATGGGGMNSQTVGAFDPPINPILTNVSFINNTATGGGGLFIGNSTGHLTNVTFSGNVANRRGGGMLLEDSTGVLTNITFYNNTSTNTAGVSPRGGGGLMILGSSPILNNVTFSGNNSTANGESGSAIRVAQSTQVGNPEIRNSIFWGDNTTEITSDGSGTVTINDSIVQGGCGGFACTNVLNSDPLLGGLADNGGWTQTMALSVGSSAIDAGNNGTCATTDQRGVTRPQGVACDMGAYEADAVPQTLTVNITGNGTGVVTSVPAGIDCGVDCTEDYAFNTLVTLTATADPGSYPGNWSEESCQFTVDCVVTMDAAKTVTKSFRIPGVLISPTGIVNDWYYSFHWTGVTGASRYFVQLQKADDTLIFQKWYYAVDSCTGLDCIATPGLNNLENGDYKWRVLDYGPYDTSPLFAYGTWTEFTNFTVTTPCYTLGTSVNIVNSGTVTTSAQNCAGGYLPGTVVQVNVVPQTGYAFTNWGGDATGTVKTVSVTMDANKSVTANLREASSVLISPPSDTLPDWDKSFHWTGVTGASRYFVQLQKADGTILMQKWYDEAAYCSGLDCTVPPVALGSLPDSGYKWRVLDYGPYGYGAWTAFNNFTLSTPCYTLDVDVNIPAGGTATPSAQNCDGGYLAGTVAQVTVALNAGYVFTDWSGDATGTSTPLSITMTSNKSVTANLREASSILISPSGTVSGWGTPFEWTGVTGATRYFVQLQKADGTLLFQKWYYADSSCTGLACVATPNFSSLPIGDYRWRVLDYGAYGYGTWSVFTNFTVE